MRGLTEDAATVSFGCANWYSIRVSKARCAMRFRGKPGGAVRALFLQYHIVQICIVNNSTLHPDSRIWRSNWGKSWNTICSLKFRWGSSFHTCARFGQDRSAWRTSSSCWAQREQLGSSTTQRRIRLFNVGMAFLHTLQRRFLILHGTESFQILFHKGFSSLTWWCTDRIKHMARKESLLCWFGLVGFV